MILFSSFYLSFYTIVFTHYSCCSSAQLCLSADKTKATYRLMNRAAPVPEVTSHPPSYRKCLMVIRWNYDII